MSTKLRKSNNTYITADEIASALTGGSGIAYGAEPSGTENYLQVPDGDGNLVDSSIIFTRSASGYDLVVGNVLADFAHITMHTDESGVTSPYIDMYSTEVVGASYVQLFVSYYFLALYNWDQDTDLYAGIYQSVVGVLEIYGDSVLKLFSDNYLFYSKYADQTLLLTLDTTKAQFSVPTVTPTKTPASAGAAGVAGEWAWDATYIYMCTATNTWRRIAHATW